MRTTPELLNSLWSRSLLAAAVFAGGCLLGAACCLAQEPAEEEAGAIPESDWMTTVESKYPVVWAVLKTDPPTPAELLRAARMLADLKRTDLAKAAVNQVAEADLDEASLASLVDELGETALAELAAKPGVRTVSRPLVQKIVEAYQSRPEDPAVAAILETKPATPAELLRAAQILSDLKRPFLAKGMVKQVAEANLDEAALARIVDELGEATLVDLGSKSQLQPEIGPLVEKALTAYQTRVRNAAKLEEAAGQLGDESPKVRADAAVALVKAGPYAVAPLMKTLVDSPGGPRRDAIRGVLLRLGPDAVKPLIALLNSNDAATVREAVSLLAALGDEGAALYLLATYAEHYDDEGLRAEAAEAIGRLMGTEPTREQAAKVLMARARRYFDGRQPMAAGPDGNVPIWVYDLEKKAPVLKAYPPEQANRRMAIKLARAATILLPDDPAAARLFLTCLFEETAYQTGLDAAAPGEPAGHDDNVAPQVLEGVLTEAMETGHIPAATIAARRLGKMKTPERLSADGVSPLAKAMQHPDRRLRLAAVGGVLDLKPTEPFPGASRVVDTLSFFASSRGRPRAMVVGPQIKLLQTLVGELSAAGFKVDSAVTGREAMRLLLKNPDYEFLFVDAALFNPDVDSFLQELRRDARTALLPVAILAREGYAEKAEHVAEKIPRTAAFPRPNDEEAVKWQLEELRKLAGDSAVSAPVRLTQAAEALSRLAEIGGLRRHAL